MTVRVISEPSPFNANKISLNGSERLPIETANMKLPKLSKTSENKILDGLCMIKIVGVWVYLKS